MQVVADTFPAGTLSGAPKHRAMQLIEQTMKKQVGHFMAALLVLWILNGNLIMPL